MIRLNEFYSINGNKYYIHTTSYKGGYDNQGKYNSRHTLKYNGISIDNKLVNFNEQEIASAIVCEKFELNVNKYLIQRCEHNTGADPEFFVNDKNGNLLPAFKFLGSKSKPSFGSAHNKIYWDGYQAEFETKSWSCHSSFVDEIFHGLQGILKMAGPGASISNKTVVDVSLEEMKTLPKEFVQFGCMPSFNAYNMNGLSMPGEETPYRSAGGHIHFGFSGIQPDVAIKVVKALDAIVGIMGVSALAKWDDPRRRKMYGLAGEYRLPPHGLEYRALSNAWMFHPVLAHIFLDISRRVAMLAKHNLFFFSESEEEVIHIINECNIVAARRMIERNKKLFMEIIEFCYQNQHDYVYNKDIHSAIYDLIISGADKYFNDNINSNWKLHTKMEYGSMLNPITNGSYGIHSDHTNGAVAFWDMKPIFQEAKAG